ncbi:MAG: hypothetical protein B6A08_18635 [Sorangiineae bacterium NIC37A_2]|nr:MAG: hypothetical protein B6A08_18635 [Sorangiineae bacterium NIC37A_2]
MAKLVFGMNVSLDGYVDHTEFAPSPILFRHFVQEAKDQTGSLYGRKVYELMRYWDEDQATWSDDERAFAAAFRKQTKWVASRTLERVGARADDRAACIQSALPLAYLALVLVFFVLWTRGIFV